MTHIPHIHWVDWGLEHLKSHINVLGLRGPPSKEYKERERAHDLLVASYVSSYDVSSNFTVVEGENMQSVKNNRHTLVENIAGQFRGCS
jgi:hypothetical protein